MDNAIEELKSTWHAHDDQIEPNYQILQLEIVNLKKQKKNKIIFWSSALIVCSLLVIGYVVYTDELNSIYKSISEILLLGMAANIFYFSWKAIQNQKKEYLLSSISFLIEMQEKERKRIKRHSFNGCLTISLLFVSLFFYFFEMIQQLQILFIIANIMLIAMLAILWFVLKPAYEQQKLKQYAILADKFSNILNKRNQ